MKNNFATYRIFETAPESPERLICVIGDVHGESDRLRQVLAHIKQAGQKTGKQPLVVFLGDYIDRGPDSKGALDLVMQTLEEYSDSVAIRGNHDARFGKWAAREPNRQQMSAKTLASFGITDAKSANAKNKKDRGHQEDINKNNIALEYREFLLDGLIDVFELRCGTGRFAFVHGGLDWMKPLEEQDPRFVHFGIGDEFWKSEAGKHQNNEKLTNVFFGHWILQHPTVWADGKIGLDTGCSTGGELTFAIFGSSEPDGTIQFLGTSKQGIVPVHYADGDEDSDKPKELTSIPVSQTNPS